MKILAPVLAALLLAGCNAAPEPSAPTAAAAATHATATGVVQSVDAAAKSLSIAHGPVEALGWPGMTMTFQAPDVDLAGIQAGDRVAFEFTATGMDGTIVAITKQ